MRVMWHRIVMIAMLMVLAVGCAEEPVVEVPEAEPAPYGYYYFGDEEVPVNAFVTAEDATFMLKLSPLDDVVGATTYAIVGVHTQLLGLELDVERHYHNDDYVFIYEDPLYYFSARRPLLSGKILLDRNSAGVVRADIDVVLYDGTTFKYTNLSLKAQE